MTKERQYIIYGETVSLDASAADLSLHIRPMIQHSWPCSHHSQDKEKVEWVQAISKTIVQVCSSPARPRFQLVF
jgi:hypothetical protein